MTLTSMNEFICRRTVELGFLILGIAGPVLGIIVGAILGIQSRCAVSGAAKGFLVGVTGTLVYGLWHAYNAITDAVGFDSAFNLVLQLLIFAFLGVVIGIVTTRILARIEKLRSR